MNIQIQLAIKIFIQETETAMETQRLVKQVWLNFISALLGSIFGLMRSFAGVLGLSEVFLDVYVKKKENEENIKDLQNKKEIFNDEFGLNHKIIKYFEKVQPLTTFYQ